MDNGKRVAWAVVVGGVWLFVAAGLGLSPLTGGTLTVAFGLGVWAILTAAARR